eukprot:CAMPEP_0202715626 /NCGR_PEP_ID=MMETSP1385-20130828/92302_1 /ASSEMBLY_ACC=CAM_ASM_000861 /TAXON_ID=933848 /ORGANISM="Elphidium margaritaceum" /LENGTH=73 /DNA_ID=CAMNT_0049376977 /DNA_START=46 /DNA_END=263 /DNA_ORIENTATION=-
MHCAIFVLLVWFFAPAASLEIVCGVYHNCVYEREQMAMKCWGWNGDGQLGLNETVANDRGNNEGEMASNLPLV